MNSFETAANAERGFQISAIPRLFFGSGSISALEKIAGEYEGKNGALFTGSSFLKKSSYFDKITRLFSANNIKLTVFQVPHEPDPALIDSAAAEAARQKISFIAAVGGGSVVDAGKAVSVMAAEEGSVKDYLEGVGTRQVSGRKIPFAAIPTTSGTGSEATKNSVISIVGPEGFKKSLRHECMVPDYAVIDPDLITSCPASVTASSGMDAVTQLLESYVSVNASVFTDSLASEALKLAGASLERAYENGNDISARSGMAWAAYVSGITLANAGLGVVHGVAGPAGGFSKVPHGIVCGTLLAPATRFIIDRLLDTDPEGKALKKYASAAVFLTGRQYSGIREACDALVGLFERWSVKFSIPPLSEYGFDKKLAEKTARASDGKNSPVKLSASDIAEIIMDRI